MKTLVYENKYEERAALHDRIFAAAEHIRNHPENAASATRSPAHACRNMLSNWWRTLRKVIVKQVLNFSTVI